LEEERTTLNSQLSRLNSQLPRLNSNEAPPQTVEHVMEKLGAGGRS